jgi:hypothetical protein
MPIDHLDGTGLGLPSDPDALTLDTELAHSAAIIGAVDAPIAGTATPTAAYSAASICNSVIESAATVNAYMEWNVSLAAGAYTLTLWHAKDADFGIASISVDGATALTTKPDMYAAAPAVNTKAVITGIQVLTSGRHTIRFTGATKNASSSAYSLAIHAFGLVRTGALA